MRSSRTLFMYDPLNRRVKSTFTDGIAITFTYDASGRLVQADDSADPHRPITLAYDTLDRLVTETTALGAVAYEYDPLGRRTQMQVNDLSPVSYTYDAASRLRTIIQAPLNPVSIDYDALDRRTKLTLPNGVSTDYQYDAASRLTALIYRSATGMLGDLSYTYDAAGNRTGVGGSFARTLLPDPIASATYDAANRQMQFGDKTMTYDANGNLTAITDPSGVTTFTWDARNQLVAITGVSVSASFTYDAVGRRQSQLVNGTSAHFIYDGLNPVQVVGALGTTTFLTGLEIDEYLTLTDAAGSRAILTDALGSAVALSDDSGVVQTQYTYEPFGATTVTAPFSANAFQYTGRENDGTGLYYYRARYYHPGLQRFLSEDPLGMLGGDVNLYAYVVNNPVLFSDPLGLGSKTCIGTARVLKGNRKTVGRQGAFPGVLVTENSAAVIPAQFGLTKSQLAPSISKIRGVIGGGQARFSGVTDVIGGRSPIPGMNVRDALQRLNPGRLIIELVTADRDLGVIDIEVMLPADGSCPGGTAAR